MADNMNGLKRTHYCGEVIQEGIDVTVGGFVQKIRDLGNLIFIDLRDKTGIVQLAFNDTTDKTIFEKAASCRSEFVLMAKGVTAKRASVNKEIKTGEIEIIVSDLRILAKAQTPPFEITNETKVNEELRLKYRYAAETLRGEDLAELLFERVADDENDLAETGADGVVDRIIYDGLVVRADSVHLLERTVTGAHTCGEDE